MSTLPRTGGELRWFCQAATVGRSESAPFLVYAFDLRGGAAGGAMLVCGPASLGCALRNTYTSRSATRRNLYFALLLKDAGVFFSNATRMCQIVGGDMRFRPSAAVRVDRLDACRNGELGLCVALYRAGRPADG